MIEETFAMKIAIDPGVARKNGYDPKVALQYEIDAALRDLRRHMEEWADKQEMKA